VQASELPIATDNLAPTVVIEYEEIEQDTAGRAKMHLAWCAAVD